MRRTALSKHESRYLVEVADLEARISDLENKVMGVKNEWLGEQNLKLEQRPEADKTRAIIVYVYDGELGAETEAAKKMLSLNIIHNVLTGNRHPRTGIFRLKVNTLKNWPRVS